MSPPSSKVNFSKAAAAANSRTNLHTHNGCTCGQCKLGGWLSPRMLYHLQSTSILPNHVESRRTQHRPAPILKLHPSLHTRAAPPRRLLPRLHLRLPHYPRPPRALAHSNDKCRNPKGPCPRDSETAYFFSKGGKAEHVLDAITYNAGVRAQEYFRELPPCGHDQNFATVRKEMGLASDRPWGPYYHVECDAEDWKAGGNVRIRRSDIIDVKASECPFIPAAWDLGGVIDWGEGMNASEMEASDRALRELNKFLEQLLPGVC
ncbi:hypothetical protein BDZ89DRAFT_1148099 [Hymenopellis radicata]|nr:hypothetical protein BDZ89DRAFT_1148099 [Hymenopellis radicata]